MKAYLARIRIQIMESEMAIMNGDKGSKTKVSSTITIKAAKIIGLTINNITSGTATLFGRRSSPLSISFRHLNQRLIS